MKLRDSSNIVTIKQGEFRVSRSPHDVFVSVLGSCIATCFYDPAARLGGMNHFLLPGHDPGDTREVKYGAHAMEQLVNALLRAGASRDRLQVSLFGGAKVIKSAGNIGTNNALFARDFVKQEGFRLVHADVGGLFGRRLRFEAALGKATSDILRDKAALSEDSLKPQMPRPTGSIELF
ncbi:MAG: chemotaxis protein CheD [Pseudomonadota bacterium]